MILKAVREEWFQDYKKPSMFIAFPNCSFKCEKESGIECCHNNTLSQAPNIEISTFDLINSYIRNPITEAIVIGGLEPFDDFEQLLVIISHCRVYFDDDIVIYTGYKKPEIVNEIAVLSVFKNIIVKFGRFVPDDVPHYDPVLGIELASSNQYAESIGEQDEIQ